MYGTGVGTGIGGAAAATGVATGSGWLLAMAGVSLAVAGWTTLQNFRHRGADQRP